MICPYLSSSLESTIHGEVPNRRVVTDRTLVDAGTRTVGTPGADAARQVDA